MLNFRSRSIQFDIRYCCQCGACIAACNFNALTVEYNHNGLSNIIVEKEKCTLCRTCVRVCPAHILSKQNIDEEIWKKAKLACLAWNNDQEIRKSSSSGGVARTVAAQCLNDRLCDKIYLLMKKNKHPWAKGMFIQKKLETKKVSNSFYQPNLFLKNFKINDGNEKLAIVGTTCQLIAASKILKGRVNNFIRIAILCKQQKHLGFTRYIAKRMGINNIDKFLSVEYRGNGWPGRMTIDKMSIDWDDAAAIPFGKRLWTVPGCHFCSNPLGYNADLTLADPWGIEKKNTSGKTMAIAWTDIGENLILNTSSLKFDSIEVEDFKRSINWHNIVKKNKIISYKNKYIAKNDIRLSAFIETLQIFLLEKTLEKINFPKIINKMISHIPDPLYIIDIIKIEK
jgi:coenzyme F420-reducing hydrogenase beta subunit